MGETCELGALGVEGSGNWDTTLRIEVQMLQRPRSLILI